MINKIKTLIIDDECGSRNAICSIVTRYCPQIEIIGIAASIYEGQIMIKNLTPQLILLDIVMPNGSDFDMLKKIDEVNFKVIFISSFDSYALQAIKFSAIDYILKPIDVEELTKAVSKVEKEISDSLNNERLRMFVENLENNQNHQLALPSKDGCEFIDASEIVYCEADGPCTWFYLSNSRKILASKNLGHYQKLLPKPDEILHESFFRTHYKYLVNLKYVSSYHSGQKKIMLSTGIKIDIAFRRLKGLKMILSQINKFAN